MAQRYFLTAESTYEDLRQYLNTQLKYPNSLGKSIFQTALQAPRDNYRRILLAVDTSIANYDAVNAAIAPLLASDAMQEVDEATYLAAVSSATAGVATWDEISNKPSTFAPSAHKSSHAVGGSDALTPADIGAASVSHAHSASDVTSGTFDVARLPVGTTSTTVCQGNDSRLSDSRTPTAHKASHATGGTDALTAADIGAAAASHAHAASDITSGTIATARLGSGTASAATFLRGDGTWSSVISTSIDGGSATTIDGGVVDGGSATTV